MKKEKKLEKQAWFMWGIMIITYMFNTFHAAAMGVIRPDLMQQFTLTEGQFVLLTNAFSYTYMLMQIPAGILLDKLGAKKISCIGNATAALGTLIFALGQNYPMLLAGRGLIGLGCSVCFLSVLKICAEWFSERIFCTMSGLTSFAGMAGAILAQTPLAILNDKMSWHNIFLMLSAITTGVVLLIVIFVKDSPQEAGFSVASGNSHNSKQEEKDISILKAVLSVLKNKYTWPPLIVYGCFYGTYLLISGIYGSSMLSAFYGCSAVTSSSCIAVAVLGCAIGSVVIGALSDRWKKRKSVQLIFGVFFVVSWIILLFGIGNGKIFLMYPIMLLLGFNSCAYSVCWSCVKESNHPAFVGISTSIANMGGYLGSILVPTIIGKVYSSSLTTGGETCAFYKVILGAVVINMIGVLIACLVKETRGENIYGK